MKAQREVGIHWSTNQMPHLPHLKFELDPLVIPSGVSILWTPHFGSCVSHSNSANSFFIWKIFIFLENDLESPFIFVLFLKGKQNKKENLMWLLIWKKHICKNRIWTRWSGYLSGRYGKDRNTPLNKKKGSLLIKLKQVWQLIDQTWIPKEYRSKNNRMNKRDKECTWVMSWLLHGNKG